MSFDALIQGHLRGPVTIKTARTGRPYATFSMSATDKRGARLYVQCIAFDPDPVAVVQSLTASESLAVSGELELTSWTTSDGTPRQGLNLTVHAAMTAYSFDLKRQGKPLEEQPDDQDGHPFDNDPDR